MKDKVTLTIAPSFPLSRFSSRLWHEINLMIEKCACTCKIVAK